MSDLFEQKAKDWDERPFPAQISEGVGRALQQAVPWRKDMQVLDFGAGTGLICAHVAPRVARVFAVDISRAMLDKLAEKTEIRSKVEIICQDILDKPLGRRVDVVVSAMAMHHVRDTERLVHAFADRSFPVAGWRSQISTSKTAVSTRRRPKACFIAASIGTRYEPCSGGMVSRASNSVPHRSCNVTASVTAFFS